MLFVSHLGNAKTEGNPGVSPWWWLTWDELFSGVRVDGPNESSPLQSSGRGEDAVAAGYTHRPRTPLLLNVAVQLPFKRGSDGGLGTPVRFPSNGVCSRVAAGSAEEDGVAIVTVDEGVTHKCGPGMASVDGMAALGGDCRESTRSSWMCCAVRGRALWHGSEGKPKDMLSAEDKELSGGSTEEQREVSQRCLCGRDGVAPVSVVPTEFCRLGRDTAVGCTGLSMLMLGIVIRSCQRRWDAAFNFCRWSAVADWSVSVEQCHEVMGLGVTPQLFITLLESPTFLCRGFRVIAGALALFLEERDTSNSRSWPRPTSHGRR